MFELHSPVSKGRSSRRWRQALQCGAWMKDNRHELKQKEVQIGYKEKPFIITGAKHWKKLTRQDMQYLFILGIFENIMDKALSNLV